MLWNVFGLEAHSPRINNHLEGWHNKLKKITIKSHVNVFEIVEAFNHEQAHTEVSIAQLATELNLLGGPGPRSFFGHRLTLLIIQ